VQSASPITDGDLFDTMVRHIDGRVLHRLEQHREQHSHDTERLEQQAARDLASGLQMLVSVVSASRPHIVEIRPLDDPSRLPRKGDLVAFQGEHYPVRFAYVDHSNFPRPGFSTLIAGCLIE
jgi:hypothetical protein